MNTGGRVLVGGVLIAAFIGAGVAIAKSRSNTGGGGKKPPSGDEVDPTFDPFDKGKDDPGGGGGGGGGGSGGGGKLGPGGFRTYGGPNGGMVFGHMSDAGISNVDWNPNGNTVRFSSDCTVVLVGRQVWRMGNTVEVDGQDPVHYSQCVEYADVKACWRHGQNLCCFIDQLMNKEGITSATQIGAALIRGMEPPCIDDDFSSWPPAMQNFVNWLRPLVNEYVLEAGGQADW